MPELPEVETVRRGLLPKMQGRRLARVVARRPDLRFPLPYDFGQRLTGASVKDIRRRAKYLLFDLDTGETLMAHLGMSGSFRMADAPFPPEKHDHVIFTLDDGAEVHFNDPRRFGFMDLFSGDDGAHAVLKDLGPEPLGGDFDGPTLAMALKGRKTPIKAALLDQRVVAGLGNIYVSESLFRAGISPRRGAHTVQGGRAEKLAAAVKDVLRAAIKSGGSSLRDHIRPDGELGYFQHSFDVYGRAGEKCRDCDCGGAIQQIVQAGRSTFFCPHRQR
ncbi:MAG: bifunctional DNA-formamidopyrimidine glycosylase/DNA-(apurinic or apyrimidinic site) lyase [Rhodospirillaceae bacterium]